jgi:hypothetical protein
VVEVLASDAMDWLFPATAARWRAEYAEERMEEYRSLQGRDQELGPPGPNPIGKSHHCFTVQHDIRFHWNRYCKCMMECVMRRPLPPLTRSKDEAVFAETYSVLLDGCEGSGYMEAESIEAMMAATTTCPRDWVRCEAKCLDCVNCYESFRERYIPWCEMRLLYWWSFFDFMCGTKYTGAPLELCREVCRPGGDMILWYVFISLASVNIVGFAIYLYRRKQGPMKPATASVLDAYDAWKEMRNIDEEELVDKQIEIQGNQTANFYKVSQLAQNPDVLLSLPNQAEELAEGDHTTVGMVEDARLGNIQVYYPENAPPANEDNRPEYKSPDMHNALVPSIRTTCQECGKWRFSPSSGPVYDRIMKLKRNQQLVTCAIMGYTCGHTVGFEFSNRLSSSTQLPVKWDRRPW